MLQQELRQRDEDIAAKAAEIGELKERVAELERLRQQQQDLLAMKDSELAAVQQRLAAARTASAPKEAVASTQVEAARAPQASPSSGLMPWIWGGLTLLGVAALIWLFSRRRTPARPGRRVFDSDALAASLRAPAREASAASQASAATAAPDSDDGVGSGPAADAPAPATALPRQETPTWHAARGSQVTPPAPAVESGAAPRFVPREDADTATDRPSTAPDAGGDHRLKLAMAFLDIGDDDSARQMLSELLHSTDPAARAEAARKLRELG